MKRKVEKLGPTVCKVSVEMGKEELEKEWNRVYSELSKDVKMPGFRPGHVPRDILEKNFRDAAEKKFVESVVPAKFEEVIAEESLFPVSTPEISDLKIQKEKFEFTLTFETKPQFKPQGYRSIALKVDALDVKEDEIKKIVDNLKQSFKSSLQIELPQDEEEKRFVHSIGFASMGELQDFLKAQLYINKFNLRSENIRSQIMDHLIKNNKEAQVPKTMLEESHRRAVEQEVENLRGQGVKDDDISKYRKDIEDKLKPVIENNLKFYIVLENIGQAESIKDDDGQRLIDKVLSFVLSQADIKTGGLV